MGILIEKRRGRRAEYRDNAACEEVAKQFHRLGYVHGDLNRHNFLVDDFTGLVTLIDFENASVYTETAARKELDNLAEHIVDESGRGGPPMAMES